MARPARFSSEQIIASTAQVVAERGPGDASVARIARALRAPVGSIYHRFPSRGALLGEVWLHAAESFQTSFFERLDGMNPQRDGLVAVRHVPQWVRENPQEARILLLYRRDDFLERGWPEPMAKRAQGLGRQLSAGLRRFCRRLVGRTDSRTLRAMTFALAEAPLAAVRRHVEAGEPPPPIVDELVAATYRSTIAMVGVPK